MGQLRGAAAACVLCLLASIQSGCTGLTAAAAIPGTMYGMVASQFTGEERSFAASLARALAATEQSLKAMRIDLDLIEIVNDSQYIVAFYNHQLEGRIELEGQTERLTTVHVRVRQTLRQESVETAIVEMIEEQLDTMPKRAALSLHHLHNLRAKPSINARRIGWYRPGALLDAHRSGTKDWLKVKLPSGKMAFLKGSISKHRR